MDFLLECIGFPPDFDHAELAALFRNQGEPAPWRDRAGRHRRLAIGDGLELRLDESSPRGEAEVWPFFTGAAALRIEVDRVDPVPDSPFDALLHGWTNPPRGRDESPEPRFRFATWLADRRRLPTDLRRGRVLAVSVAGYALDLRDVRPSQGAPRIEPLGGPDDPGGSVDLALEVLEIERLENPLTRSPVERLVLDAPGRPLTVFTSPWQRELDGLPDPRPGWEICGTFLFNGRVAGGLPSPTRRLGRSFG